MVEHAGSSSRSNSKGNKNEQKEEYKKSKGSRSTLDLIWDCEAEFQMVNLAVNNGQKLYMGNSATADIKGEGDGVLKIAMFTFEKKDKAIDKYCFYTKLKLRITWKNRTLKEMVTAMLISSGMSQDMWGEAILTATYLLNKIPQTGSSARLDDEVVQDKRQRDDNDLQDERQDQTEEEEVEPRRSKRARNEKSFGPDFVSFMVENEPTSYREAVTSSEGQQWREAIKSEIDSILQNHTWELVDLPPGCKPLGYKWIFKKKMKADGTIDKYKARLVIKGYRQREGLDYFDTYSPVTRITSIRMILAIAALRNLEIHQMDVKTAFLNGDLEEEIYMNQPEGFIAPGQEGKIVDFP
ncbi:retrovirus-related pol polyprotein from transposon TNT 1-94, partial [Tanacetum coccineum]